MIKTDNNNKRPSKNRSFRSPHSSKKKFTNKRSKNQKNSKWHSNRLSYHFTKRDFDTRRENCSCKDNLKISLGLVGVIEALRSKINKRITIVKGFYCPECYKQPYGIKRNYHIHGLAADIRIDEFPLEEIFLIAETFPEIKGLGINFDDNHVHIDTRKEKERSIWVETKTEIIDITEENRSTYIKATLSQTSSDDNTEPS